MSMSMTATSDLIGADQLGPLKSQIKAALSGGGAKSLDLGLHVGAQQDTGIAAASFLASMTAALAQQPNLITQLQSTMQKAYTTPIIQDPMRLNDKSWWNDVFHVIQQGAPIALQIFNAVSGGRKDFAAVVSSPVVQRHANDKDWQNFVADLLTQVTPLMVHALRGTKDFSQPGALMLNIQPPTNIQGDPKAWWNDVLQFVGDALPVVLPIVMSVI
jgi:hypothetical protein